MAFYHGKSDHDLMTVETMADLFGCLDDSYKNTLVNHRHLVQTRPALGFCEGHMLTHSTDTKTYAQLDQTTRLLDSLICSGPANNKVVLSGFCHLHLPAFVRAFRATACDGERRAATLDDDPGPDEHVWASLWLIVREPLFVRFVREHAESPGLLDKAMQFLTLMLKGWGRRLDSNRNWRERFDESLGYAVQAILFLIVLTPCQSSSSCPYPCHELAGSHAHDLFHAIADFTRSLTNTPSKLAAKVRQSVGDLKFALSELRDCINKDLKHECDDYICIGDAHKIKRNLPWHRCEGRSVAKAGECETDTTELMACSRCQSVRYCSRAHQKAHWKTHKLTCKEPNW